ncbi:DinB family protein [Flavobacterium sp. FBOR7N2.3]|uniref:DinB family protein n=1 Tax=Flavobacterium magnesitis TaxID=3138077 RepID=A0ABV4TFM0_9FLAO
MLIPSINRSLNELVDLLVQISNSEYARPCAALSNSTIGEHTRHIVEMFQCLNNSYVSGMINYDKRPRNKRIETDTEFAKNQINLIQNSLEKENKKLLLLQVVDQEELHVESNYYRELLYNLEHCIHHQALIKVAVLQYETITIDPNFGVARSTIEYRNQCAQ